MPHKVPQSWQSQAGILKLVLNWHPQWGLFHNPIHISHDAVETSKFSERCQLEEASPAIVINSALLPACDRPSGKTTDRILAQEHISKTLSPVYPCEMEETHICSTTVHTACFQKRAWGLFLGREKAQQCAATFAVQTHQQEELCFYSLAHIHSMITVTSNWHLAYVFCYSPGRKGPFLFFFIYIFAEYGECRLKTCISTETINTSLQLYQMWGCACSFGCNCTGWVSCQA